MATRLSRVTVQAPGDPLIAPRPAPADAAAMLAPMFELTRAMLDISRDWLDLQRSLMRQQQDLALEAAQHLMPRLQVAQRSPGGEAADFPAFALATRMMGLMLEAGTAGLRQPAAVPDEAPAPQRPAA
jgi:hypothetical protein